MAEIRDLIGGEQAVPSALRWLVAGILLSSVAAVRAEAGAPDCTHREFVAEWFPRDAAAAVHVDVAAIHRLASQANGEPSHFGSVLETLDLIRGHVGFDHTQIEHFTTATITAGDRGSVTFFTLVDPLPLSVHFDSGQVPTVPGPDQLDGKIVYNLKSGGRALGLFSPAGKHCILGDWTVFKAVLKGNGENLNQIAKNLDIHSAPIILGTNPRRQGKRYAEDSLFGTVVSLDFDPETLAFLMQEEHPTPQKAEERQVVIEEEMPAIFEERYGLTTKMGVRFQSFADGRFVTFAGTAAVADSRRLLETLLGKVLPSDPGAKAKSDAAKAIELYRAALAAGTDCSRLASESAIVEALCSGLGGGARAKFQLPFLTRVERQRIAGALVLDAGELKLAPEPEEPEVIEPSIAEKQIHRHARLIATLSSSAAAVDSPQLKGLTTVQEIVKAICSTGLASGPGYEAETFKGPELSKVEVEQVAQLLVPSHGYLVYQAPSGDE